MLSPIPQFAPNRLLARARQALTVLRLRPFDCSTPAGRSLERYRRAALSTVAAAGGRVIGISTTLVTVPLTLSYLGDERYGMWTTISSLIAIFSFTDLGIGSGLIGAMSEANARGDREKACEYASSALFMLTGLGVLLLSVFAAAYPFVPWGRVFNVSSAKAVAEAGPAVATFLACQALAVLLSVIPNTRLGLQEGFANALWQSVGSVLALVAVIVAIRAKASLPVLIVATSCGPLLGVLGNALVLYGRDHPYLRPRMSAVTWAGGKRLCRMGSLFLALQLAAALGFSSDNLVAAQVVGGHAVPSYAIPYRLFALSLTVVQLLAGPLWPAYTEAITRGDRAWVRRTLVRSLTLSVSISLASSVLLLVFGNAILAVWVGPHIRASYWLLLGLAIWNVFSGAGVSMAMLFNGAHVVGFQVASALSMAVLNICLSIALARQVGLPGIIWGTVISYGLCAVIPWIFFVPRLLRLQGGAVDEPPSGAVAAAPPLAS